MIDDAPSPSDSLDQGDVIDGCPLVEVATYRPDLPDVRDFVFNLARVVVLTQTCDLTNQKVRLVVVAPALDAQQVVSDQSLTAADVKKNVRAGRIWGWYFLPADAALGLPEMLVDLRRLHTLRLDLLGELCRAGNRRGRIRPLYREHLAKHFADTYSRIGLPRPIETM